MKHFFFFTLLSLGLTCSLIAAPVDSVTARRVAASFFATQRANAALVDATAKTGLDNLYLFECADKGGFVVVAAHDVALPILAFSSDALTDDSLHASLRYWLRCLNDEIADAVAAGLKADDYTAALWSDLLSDAFSMPEPKGVVSPLLLSHWNQGYPYNIYCPADHAASDGHAPVGCSATAMAQIMRYWKYPDTGNGSYSYYMSRYGDLSADFGATHYLWDSMPDGASSASSPAQIDAVATLSYHCGISIEMSYGPNGSGANVINFGDTSLMSVQNALRRYFGYRPSLQGLQRSHFEISDWVRSLKDELKAGRPVLYAGFDEQSGHAFVFDGFNGINQFHVNWGWGGYYDGYYVVTALNPGMGGTGGTSSGTYNLGQQALLGIQPALYNIDVAVNDTLAGSVTGAGRYALADTVVLTALPNDGYRFVQWSDGSVENPRTWVVTADTLFTATFKSLAPAYSPSLAQVAIFPNPARSLVRVEADGLRSIVVYRADGARVLAVDDAASFDVSSLPQGSYLLKLVTSQGVVYKSLAVCH